MFDSKTSPNPSNPPYTSPPATIPQSNQFVTSPQIPAQYPTPLPPPTAYTPLFPPLFGFYRHGSLSCRWTIALHKDTPSLFTISTHSGFSGKPSVVLHGQGIDASANMHSFSSTTEVLINGAACSFQRKGHFRKSYVFSLPVSVYGGSGGGSGEREEWEWRRGNGQEVRGLGGRRGMELVRERTGQVVAVWAHTGWSLGKKGKMAWCVGAEELGELGGALLEGVAVLVVLCVLEKERRAESSVAAGGGGG